MLSTILLACAQSSASPPAASTLKRLPDLDLRPVTIWQDLPSILDWIALEDEVVALVWRGSYESPESWVVAYRSGGAPPREWRLNHRGRCLVDLGSKVVGILEQRADSSAAFVRLELATGELATQDAPPGVSPSSWIVPAGGGSFFEQRPDPVGREVQLCRIESSGSVSWRLGREQEYWCDGGLAQFGGSDLLAWNRTDPPAVQIVSSDGHVRRTRLLRELDPSITDLKGAGAGPGGGVLLDVGCAGGRRLLQLDAAFQSASVLQPECARQSGWWSMRADPAGHAWLHDGFCLSRIDAHGACDLRLGSTPEAPLLLAANAVALERDGTILAQSAQDGGVYELDGQGGIVQRYPPPRLFLSGQLDFDSDEIGLPRDLRERHRKTLFDQGRRAWKLEGQLACLAPGDHDPGCRVRLDDADDRPGSVRLAATSRNGTLAAIVEHTADQELVVVTPRGDKRCSIRLGKEATPFVAIDERWIAVATEDSVAVHELDGRLLAVEPLPSDGGSRHLECANGIDRRWRVDLRPTTKELWLREGPNTLFVRRYALP